MGYLSDIVAHYEVELERRARNLEYLNNPRKWAQDKLGMDLWYKQEDVALSIVRNKNTAVRAGHGVGKSFLAALLSCWWVDVHPLGTAFVATTAPSADQVSTIIFREIKRLHLLSRQRAKELGDETLALPGRVTENNEWKIEQANQSMTVAKGRKPPDNKSEDAFQGIHTEYVLSIGDEACGLTESMIDGLANITSNETSRRLLIGNPTDPSSHFGKIFREENSAWNLIGISVFDNPNFHGRGICSCHKDQPPGLGLNESALRSLSDQSFVDDKIKEFGEDSPRFQSRVRGIFAFDAGNNLFTEYDLAQGKNCVVMPDPEFPYLVLGVDVARMGSDKTYVYSYETGFVQKTNDETGEPTGKLILDEDGEPIRGGRLRHVEHWGKSPFTNRTEEDGTVTRGSSERIHEIAMALGAAEVRVDASGMGHGVIDPLYNLAEGRYKIIEVLGGAASPDRRAYRNLRAFNYAEMQRKLFQGVLDIDPKDEILIEELGGIQYEWAEAAAGGGMQIETKESMKKRGVKSPDAADAAWYACMSLEALVDDPFAESEPGTILTSDLSDYEPSSFFQYSW